MNATKNMKLIKVLAGAAAGTTTLTSDPVDTQGFEGVMFFGSIATVNAGNWADVYQGQAANMSDGAFLSGARVVPGDNGDSFCIDILRPGERYVDVRITRTVSTATGDVYALLYGSVRKAPVSQGTTIDAITLASPVEDN